MRDYEVLRRELPDDNEVAESLFHAQVALKKSRGEEVYNMKFGGDVESVSGLEQFRAAISSSGECGSIIISFMPSIQLLFKYSENVLIYQYRCNCRPLHNRLQHSMQTNISVL